MKITKTDSGIIPIGACFEGGMKFIPVANNRKYAYLESDSDLWAVDNVEFSTDGESGETLVWMVELMLSITPLAWKHNW